MIAEFYDIEGKLVSDGAFSLITKSLYRAVIDVQQMTGFELSLVASHFAVFQNGNKRLVVSVQNG
jgi:hypothetical protein